jgi:uncharacterized protein YdhG (YjbR/CyaY superfamily)
MTIIDEYLTSIDPPQRSELERIRRIVHDTLPEVEEIISYGMPGFKYKGKYLVGFNAFKDHLSLFPTAGPVEALKSKLGAFTLSKGTIQFTLERPLPEPLIKEILLARAGDITAD